MNVSVAAVRLSVAVALLAVLTAGVGLFWQGQGSPFLFTTLRGQTVEIYGQGLYRYDTSFKAPILRGTDAATLFVGVPALTAAIARYRRGSLRGALLLTGMLAFFLYNAASLALGVAYNALAPVYIAYFSASLFAFLLVFTSINLPDLAGRISPGLPHRAAAVFLFLAGLSVFVWLIDIVGGLAQGQAPQHLASYTTEPTHVFDLGIIGPTAFLAGILLLRRAPLGYLLAAAMLILNAMVGIMVVGQTVAQSLAGIALSAGEVAAFVAPFVLMSLVAVWLARRLLGGIADLPAQQQRAGTKP